MTEWKLQGESPVKDGDDTFLLLVSDFCPFAQRAWIAALETARAQPQRINLSVQQVSYFNRERPLYDLFKRVNPSKTVPAALHLGNRLCESDMICRYLDETFQAGLQPKDGFDRYRMNSIINAHGGLVGNFYRYLMNVDEKPELWTSFQGSLDKLEAELSTQNGEHKSDEYYLLGGGQYSLADVFLFPFMERAMVLLPKYRARQVQEDEYPNIFRWYNSVAERPAVATTLAARTEESMKTFPFEARERAEYLQEVYVGYAKGFAFKIKEALYASNPAPGKRIDYTPFLKKLNQSAKSGPAVPRWGKLLVGGVAALVGLKLAGKFSWK